MSFKLFYFCLQRNIQKPMKIQSRKHQFSVTVTVAQLSNTLSQGHPGNWFDS